MSKIDFDKLKAIEGTMQPDECESCQIETGVIESINLCDYCKFCDDDADGECGVCGPRYDRFDGKRVREL